MVWAVNCNGEQDSEMVYARALISTETKNVCEVVRHHRKREPAIKRMHKVLIVNSFPSWL